MPPAVVLPNMKRQPRRLLDIATPLPPVEGQGNPNRWLEGVTWAPRDCSELSPDATVDPCEDDSFGEVWTIGCDEWQSATPFSINQKFAGTLLNVPDRSYAADRLQENYDRMLSAIFANQLTNTFADIAIEPTNGQAFADAAIPVYQAMAILEDTIADRLHGGIGYIHIPPLLLARACYSDSIYLGDDGNYYTPAGNIVISDAGYSNAAPPSGGSSADLTDWIYCSGEVFWATTAEQLLDPTLWDDSAGADDTAGFNRNRYEQYIRGFGILVVDDECAISGVNATLVEV